LSVSPELPVEDLAHLYWGAQALDPVACDVNDDELIARFVRHAPSLDVAAWAVIDDVRALPHARLIRAEATTAGNSEPELVLTGGDTTNSRWRDAV